MVQNNKVLTVSYGTFSCTLEGFDDSFETMKAIAEYFRDLAADDRYFGSEPPQPDAEMLARIAQRDASRRVEAHQQDTGLVLRATDAPLRPTPRTAVRETPSPMPGTFAPSDDTQSFAPRADTEARAAPPAADSIAAKLQRIRAVVSHGDDSPAAYSEDEENEFLATRQPQVDAISAAFDAGALNPGDLDAPETESEAAHTDDYTDIQDTPPLIEDIEDTVVAEPVAEHQPVDTEIALGGPALDDPDTTDAPSEDVLTAAETTSAPDTLEFADTPSEAALVRAEDTVDTADTPTDEAEEAADITAEVLFNDLDEDTDADAEPETGEIRNILDETDDAEDLPGDDAGVLTAEDEEFILSEISDLETRLSAPDEDDEDDAANIDTDVLRLMQKADAQMEDPATTGTRETYSHLRTAVAATEAERQASGATADAEDQKYRGDLASVVSPRRPDVQVTSERPQPEAAAPLKLVAEQRIDTDSADTGPVTPRRVTTAEDEDESDESGFAHFAREQGAQSLPDLLEAAAAYLSFIEGQEQFSRPQLMNKVRSLKQDEFNREESLRSFGQLLRDGKIEKAGGGRFAASNQIGFRPDDKRAAG